VIAQSPKQQRTKCLCCCHVGNVWHWCAAVWTAVRADPTGPEESMWVFCVRGVRCSVWYQHDTHICRLVLCDVIGKSCPFTVAVNTSGAVMKREPMRSYMAGFARVQCRFLPLPSILVLRHKITTAVMCCSEKQSVIMTASTNPVGRLILHQSQRHMCSHGTTPTVV
jgi:hypothetical protein